MVSTLFVSESVPLRLLPLSVPLPLKAMLDSPSALPELLIVPFAKVKFETWVPLIPLPRALDVQVRERGALRAVQRDAVAGRVLNRAAGVVAALRRVAAAGDGEAAA